MTLADQRVNIVILSCAVSAGIHGALVPDHFREGRGAGIGFVAATVLLAILAVVLTRSASQLALVATAAVLAGLLTGYALAITTGVPVLHPDVEAVDALALTTKAVEAAGLLTAASLVRRPSFASLRQPKGTLA
jgi:xanthine/uracil permease